MKVSRPYTKKPIVGVGRFTNPETMVRLVSTGALDIIWCCTPLDLDPYLR